MYHAPVLINKNGAEIQFNTFFLPIQFNTFENTDYEIKYLVH